MNEKKFGKFFIANLKRTAQMVSPMVREKSKLEAQRAEIENRINTLNEQIASMDKPIRIETGFGVEDLVVREVVETGKFDKDGKPVKVTKFKLRYPETVVPVVEAAEETVINENKEEQQWQ